MSKSWIILYSFYLRIHEGEDFLFYLMVVGLDSLFEIIRANFICKVYYQQVWADRLSSQQKPLHYQLLSLHGKSFGRYVRRNYRKQHPQTYPV